MKHIQNLAGAVLMGSLLMACAPEEKKTEETTDKATTTNSNMVRLITLDPGHFHAALVQKTMFDKVDSTVHVYAPEGSDVQDHLKRIEGYNSRQENPTHWKEEVYTGPDFLQKMVEQKKGNVVVISGNNLKKTEYIKESIDAGLHVLADKPMCIDTEGFELLKASFEAAEKNKVLLYDIMTERSEITTVLQKELAQLPEIFGELQKGTVKDPAVTKESVHHFYKYVSGSPLKRPAWFMDVAQQGEGIVDVTTHLVDLVQWECFPEQTIDYQKDIEILQVKRWPTPMTRSQFALITGQPDFPEYLRKDVVKDTNLNVYSNGEINYTLKGIHAKVSVIWNYKAPEGAGDTHYSIMKGSKANLVIRQGAEQKYVPELYLEPAPKTKIDEKALVQAFEKIKSKYAGVELKKLSAEKWQIVIPEKYRTGHEAHFGEVAQRFLQYLEAGKLPDWEVPNMLAKYYTTTQALSKAKASSNLSAR
ncbi:putative oxidoreductase C-terminal domain-containing protein [Rhodocytophaga aerolata]|uniref:Oxidoreductase C-terminal domain-containing protein n=1 Tax=Rhodocytophaga aerolata TaxID=455078 RepID=A0ABT8R3P5_9BACT|nr:putative oxidoreductase C-terminal domain-containing protein [Rhodocytophaga aerolata]MDO1445898.1 putative oxidoreductase C-terminal domain-containing protein [Rhodocytophaga aerolata]